MATSTLAVMDRALSEGIGDFLTLDTTADGDAAGFTVVSTALLNETGGTDTDFFEGWWCEINDSDATLANGEIRRLEAYLADRDSPTLRAQDSFSEQIKLGITIILHRYNPTDKGNVIRQAIGELFPDLYLPIRDESLIVDNLLTNSGFETFASSAFTGWTTVGSPTLTQETTIVHHGSSSAKIVSSGSAVGQLTQAPTISINELTNKTAKAKRWVYATEPNTARLRLDWDGSNFASSSYHSGKDQWEKLSVEAKVPNTATQVKMICESAISGTGYFDLGWLEVGPVYEYTVPTSIIAEYLHSVTQQSNEDDVDGPYYPIPDGGRPAPGRILRLRGMGLLSQPTTDSGTTEVGEPRVRLIVAYAEMLLWRLLASPTRSAGQDRQGYQEAGRDAATKVAVIKAQKGIKIGRMGSQHHRNNWHIENNSGANVLVFDRTRA